MSTQPSNKSVVHSSAQAALEPFSLISGAVHLGANTLYDGRLEVHKMYELNLSKGNGPIVLSCCKTGTGDGFDFGLLNDNFLATVANQVVVC